MLTQGYLWLEWLTNGYTKSDIVTQGYIWLQCVPYANIGMQCVIVSYKWL